MSACTQEPSPRCEREQVVINPISARHTQMPYSQRMWHHGGCGLSYFFPILWEVPNLSLVIQQISSFTARGAEPHLKLKSMPVLLISSEAWLFGTAGGAKLSARHRQSRRAALLSPSDLMGNQGELAASLRRRGLCLSCHSPSPGKKTKQPGM